MKQRYNPTRRGDIELDRCLCGFSRKRNEWVRNGCRRHPVKALVKSERIFCGDRLRGCGGELTEADLEAGCCTQCGEPLVVPELPLEHALLMSIAEVQSQRVEEVNRRAA